MNDFGYILGIKHMWIWLAFIFGVVLAALTHHFSFFLNIAKILLGISSLCWISMGYFLWRKPKLRHLNKRMLQLGLGSLVCALGLMLWQSAYLHATRWQLPQTLAAPLHVTVDGTMIGLPAVKMHSTEVTVAVSQKMLLSAMHQPLIDKHQPDHDIYTNNLSKCIDPSISICNEAFGGEPAGVYTQYMTERDSPRITKLQIDKTAGQPFCPVHIVQRPKGGGSRMTRRPGPQVYLRLQWYQLNMPLWPGQRWHLQLTLRPLHGFQNPGSFDYPAWLLQQDVQAVGDVVSASPLATPMPLTWRTRVDRWRAKLRQTQVASLPTSPLVGVLTALCLGDKSLVSPKTQQVFIRTGTAHLLAISGLHIGLVAGLAWLLARRLWRLWPRLCLWLPAKTAGLWMGVVAAWGYALLAGLAVSTQRAALMVSLAAFALGCQRQLAWPFVWVFTLALVLMISPMSVTSSGLWLSFSAVLALSYLGLHPKPVRLCEEDEAQLVLSPSTLRMTILSFMNNLYYNRLYPWLKLQVCLTLLLAPLMLALFHQVSLASIPANLIAIPWIGTLIVPLVLVGTLLQPLLPWVGHSLLLLSLHGLIWIWPILTDLAAVPYVTWAGGVSTLLALLLGLWATMWLLAPASVPWRQLGLGLLLPAWLNPGVAPVWGGVSLTVLDVGQGLSTVVRTQHHTLVYDTGPGDPKQFNAGGAVLVPFLRDQGVRHINQVLLSHGDNDHIAGLPALYQSYGQVPVLTSAPARIRRVLALSSYYPINQCLAGQHWRWDGVDFAVLYPDANHLNLDNDSSCVLQIIAGGKTILLPGDIEAQAEQTLLTNVRATTVLIAPHHGSAGAALPQFLMTIAPKYVIFATGYLNRFHFPRARVIESYQALHSQMFNTAYDGAVTVMVLPSGQMRVKTFVARD